MFQKFLFSGPKTQKGQTATQIYRFMQKLLYKQDLSGKNRYEEQFIHQEAYFTLKYHAQHVSD